MQQELPESIASRYRVLGLLGAGGIGVVYQAFDQVLDKKVAVKVLLHLSDNRKARLSFQQCEVDLKVVKILRDELKGCRFAIRQGPID